MPALSRFSGIGGDEYGDWIVEDLRRSGVDVSAVIRDPTAASHFAFILVDPSHGTRTVFWSGKGSHLRPEEVQHSVVGSGRYLLVDTYEGEASLRATELAGQSGVPILLDAEDPIAGIEEMIRRARWVIVGRAFAERYTGQQEPRHAARLLAGPNRGVVITLGERGCWCHDAEEGFQSPGFSVPVRDTTGAGDVFHGAFVYGLLRGWKLPRVARFANATAALKCRGLGGRSAIPGVGEVEKFLEHSR